MNILELYNQTINLHNKQKWFAEELIKLTEKITHAQKWNKQQPAIASFLEQLQMVMQERSIGQFAKLLTAINQDVLQNNKEISLESYMSHGLPALKIETLSNGFNESIMEGSGAAVANVISTGLRFIALSRLKHRQFIVLDEPDCWISPDRVPLFAKVIGEVAKTLNIQTIIISHHKHDYFKQYGRVIKLIKKNGQLETELVSDIEGQENPQAIKKVILKNIMSHQYTEYELHPQVTCIIGDNDIGKSVLLSALKAVAYGDSTDSFIRHGEPEAQVQVFFEDKIIAWQRFLKVSPKEHPQKVLYSLYQQAQEGFKLLHKEYIANNAPDWLEKELNIKLSNNIDIQIGNQKEPIFLLGSGTKAQDRAKILSLGQESMFIQKMMERLKEKTKENKQLIKESETRGKIVKRSIDILDNTEELFNKSAAILETDKSIREKAKKIEELKIFKEHMGKVLNITQITKVNFNIKKCDLHKTEKIDLLIKEMKKKQNIINIPLIKEKIKKPETKNTSNLKQLIINYKKINSLKKIGVIKYDKQIPKFKDTKNISALGEKIYNVIQELNVAKNRLNKVNEEQNKIIKQLNLLIKENNNLCPTCKQTVKVENFINHNH